MVLLSILPDKSVDMVYGDPDYNVGVKYGDKSYQMKFAEYMNWYARLALESLRVLKDAGNAFFINYPKQNAHLRVRLPDELYHNVYEYVWVYNSNIGQSPRHFTTAHRSILHCTKQKDNNFFKDNVAVPYQNPGARRIKANLAAGSRGRMPYDWFYFDLVKNVSREKTFHPCQIPIGLSSMLIKSCTQESDTVLVLFGGSGSEIQVCQTLKRNFISAETNQDYYKLIQRRLGGKL
jgi:DNA modification methylase